VEQNDQALTGLCLILLFFRAAALPRGWLS
jgi:hypothetical protein